VAKSFKLIVAYDGADYVGWQIQSEGTSVQGELENALREVTGETIRAIASGRTDSGVHALGQVVSFESDTALDTATLFRALNAKLPKQIRVLGVEEAEPGFHAIRDAVSKRYRYFIQDGGVQDPFLRTWCWYVPQKLDDWNMQDAANELFGEHDFATYQSSGSPRSTTVRTILDFKVERQVGQLCEPVVIEVAATGFLYNMVRNLVGTLVEVGLGKQDINWPKEILAAKDRKTAGQTAPPQGLFLVSVEYPGEESPDSTETDSSD
jgi:tRNA pseudouridine38-40 synthase